MKRYWIIGLVLISASTLASDGVIEINQLCVNTGCFDGDTAGFPVQITSPGSYRLTSNLDVRSLSTPQNRDAIAISSNNVTLDLNGFSLIGPVSCTGATPTCSPSGAGVGIVGTALVRSVTIENGAITGFGEDGININGSPILIRDMHISNNSDAGIVAISGGRFIDNEISNNGGIGIDTSNTGLILNSRFANNGAEGVDAGACGNNIFILNGGSGEQSCTAQISTNLCFSSLIPCT
ncbi:MAG: right-handed parallel beta-helix repeat-containing protein [Pseudomonadota bacterium]